MYKYKNKSYVKIPIPVMKYS